VLDRCPAAVKGPRTLGPLIGAYPQRWVQDERAASSRKDGCAILQAECVAWQALGLPIQWPRFPAQELNEVESRRQSKRPGVRQERWSKRAVPSGSFAALWGVSTRSADVAVETRPTNNSPCPLCHHLRPCALRATAKVHHGRRSKQGL
jgi:hypothetical protein